MIRWRNPSYVMTIALAFVLLAVLLTALWGSGVFTRLKWNPDVWAASLICNLLTTGLTIYFVNNVFVKRETVERARSAATKDAYLSMTSIIAIRDAAGATAAAFLAEERRAAMEAVRPMWQEAADVVFRETDRFAALFSPETRTYLRLLAEEGVKLSTAPCDDLTAQAQFLMYANSHRTRAEAYWTKGVDVLLSDVEGMVDALALRQKLLDEASSAYWRGVIQKAITPSQE